MIHRTPLARGADFFWSEYGESRCQIVLCAPAAHQIGDDKGGGGNIYQQLRYQGFLRACFDGASI
jgi:hypothetical protein